jgi:hypothetical protein
LGDALEVGTAATDGENVGLDVGRPGVSCRITDGRPSSGEEEEGEEEEDGRCPPPTEDEDVWVPVAMVGRPLPVEPEGSPPA